MIYQLTANLFFETEDPIRDIKDKILDHWPEARVVKPGQLDQQCSTLETILCHHDETPNQPCTRLFYQDNCPPPPG